MPGANEPIERRRGLRVPKSKPYAYVGVSRPQWHKALVVEHYKRGLSFAQIERLTGVPASTARHYCRQEGVTRTASESVRLRDYSPESAAGRARLEKIRRIARERSLGTPWGEICRSERCSSATISRILRTPYSRALETYVFGNAADVSPRNVAVEMHFEMGLPADFIARTVGREAKEVAKWIRIEAGRGRSHCSSTHSPQGRPRRLSNAR